MPLLWPGLGEMTYGYFISYNIVGGMVWTALVHLCGIFLRQPAVCAGQFLAGHHRHCFISALPAVYEVIQARREGAKKPPTNVVKLSQTED